MIGERDPQAPMWSYRVNLDKRVRSDHPLRRINEALDLSFVGGQVAHTYGRRGNKSVPPEVILRMMLLLFLDDIKSERELTRIIPALLYHEKVNLSKTCTLEFSDAHGKGSAVIGSQ